MNLSRPHKLGWIAFVLAIVGFLISEVLGATTSTQLLIIISVPVLIGVLIGYLGFDANGEFRNGKIVGISIGGVFLIVAMLIGLAVYVIYSSTDL